MSYNNIEYRIIIFNKMLKYNVKKGINRMTKTRVTKANKDKPIISFQLSQEALEDLQLLAKYDFSNLSVIIRKIILTYLKEHKEELDLMRKENI